MLVERRAYPRVNVLADCNGMILVDVPSLRTTGLLIDLSEDGLGVQFAAPIPDVATIDVDFLLGHGRVAGTCDAIWSTPSTRGLHFRALPQEDRTEIRSWLQSLQSTNQLTSSVAVGDPSDPAAPQPSEAPPSGAANGNWGEMEDSTGCDANAASAVPPIRAGVGGSDARSKRAQPDRAIRIAARQELMERLRIGRDVAVLKPDSQPLLTDEIRRSLSAEPRAQAHRRTYPHGVWWAIILIVTVAGGVDLWRLHSSRNILARAADPDASAVRKYWVGAGVESQQSPLVGIVEIVEGEAVAHSHVRSKRRPQTIIPGTAVVREFPTYDNTALASGAQGDVHAVLTISDRGIVQDVRITEGNGIFAKEVTATSAHWRYTPYFDDSGPVSVDLPVTFKFHLRPKAGVKSRDAGHSN